MYKFSDLLWDIVTLLAVLGLIGLLVCGIMYDNSITVVETYTVGCEVSQMAYAEEATGRSRSKPVYKMGVRNDDFATTIDITGEQFAMFVIGDVVEIKVTIYEYLGGYQETGYELIGLHK